MCRVIQQHPDLITKQGIGWSWSWKRISKEACQMKHW